jgi:hypothetical protein
MRYSRILLQYDRNPRNSKFEQKFIEKSQKTCNKAFTDAYMYLTWASLCPIFADLSLPLFSQRPLWIVPHGIFLLTIISLLYTILDLPFTISFYRLGHNSPKTPSFCLWWYWIDHSILTISLFLTATASVERHILIFRSAWLNIYHGRWILHYIPLIFCVVYPPIYYLILMYLHPWVNPWGFYHFRERIFFSILTP